MKRIFLALAISALFLPAPRQATAGEVSVDFFYNNINGGSWVEVGNYGYCWQPEVAVSDSSWRPYTDGYWAYTDVGWRSEEHTSELQSQFHLVCRLLLEKKKNK